MTRLSFFFEEVTKPYPERFGNVPQRHDRRISLAQLQSADVSAINAHTLSKRGLGQPGLNP